MSERAMAAVRLALARLDAKRAEIRAGMKR